MDAVTDEIVEENKPKSNVVSLVATGGGDGRNPWLLDCEVGCCFLARPGAGAMLHEFWVVAKSMRAVKLLAVQSEKEVYMWVDPIHYSNEFKLYEVLDP